MTRIQEFAEDIKLAAESFGYIEAIACEIAEAYGVDEDYVLRLIEKERSYSNVISIFGRD